MRVVIALVALTVRLVQSHVCGYSVLLYEVTGKARCQFPALYIENAGAFRPFSPQTLELRFFAARR